MWRTTQVKVSYAVGVAQRRHGFVVVIVGRAEVCNHDGVCVATERVLACLSKYIFAIYQSLYL